VKSPEAKVFDDFQKALEDEAKQLKADLRATEKKEEELGYA
jgi:hypothetical protein